MAASRRKLDDKNLEILREIISMNGNKYCLDCNQRGPTYVNTTIGSFVCSKCSGMLRGLTPPHRVKSISMASFTPEEIEFIKIKGNDYCRRVWLGLYEGESVNVTDEQSVRDFMSDKYEKKRYYLESSPNSAVVTNGSVSSKNKTKGKLVSSNVAGPTASLISISPQILKSSMNNNNAISTAKVVSNFTSANDVSHKIPRPVNNITQPLLNSIPVVDDVSSNSTIVPDFPVDFTTANIYNSAQTNSSLLNNNIQLRTTTAPAFNAFGSSTSTSNDRYAALADLDLALRQQKIKNMEDTNNIASKNPFQSSPPDLFVNKNPFFNGGWNTNTGQTPINPFMPSSNNGSFVNSKNPFL